MPEQENSDRPKLFSGAEPELLKDAIVKSLDADKAEDIAVADLRDKSSIADFLVIASGRSTRQVGAMAQHVVERMGPDLGFPIGVEGLAQCDWVLLDCGDVVVHLFRPEVRAFYAIEKMWGLEPPALPAGTDIFGGVESQAEISP